AMRPRKVPSPSKLRMPPPSTSSSMGSRSSPSAAPASRARSHSGTPALLPTREGTISSELYEEIISGRGSRERKLAVCGGSARLPAHERAELLAILSEERDQVVQERAANALISQPVSALAKALEGPSPAPALFRYCGKEYIKQPEIALALV